MHMRFFRVMHCIAFNLCGPLGSFHIALCCFRWVSWHSSVFLGGRDLAWGCGVVVKYRSTFVRARASTEAGGTISHYKCEYK